MTHRSHRAAVLGVLLLALTTLPALAASFWLDHGYTRVAVCPGATDRPMKSANGEAILLITAVLECTDLQDSYQIKIRVLKLQLNALQRVDKPDVFHFDWVGLALYRAADASQETIDWLYDDAVSIDGDLDKNSDEILNYSDITFTYSKAAAEQATHMTLYIAFNNRIEQFGLL